jgi:uncharacterized membrane protein (UPF0127 family)
VVIGPVVEARKPWTRFVGLMGRRDVADVRMWFPRCNAVHTCFMRVPIDVIFLDGNASVVEIAPAVRPWRFVSGGRRADSVLEARAGFAANNSLSVGDRIEWR